MKEGAHGVETKVGIRYGSPASELGLATHETKEGLPVLSVLENPVFRSLVLEDMKGAVKHTEPPGKVTQFRIIPLPFPKKIPALRKGNPTPTGTKSSPYFYEIAALLPRNRHYTFTGLPTVGTSPLNGLRSSLLDSYLHLPR